MRAGHPLPTPVGVFQTAVVVDRRPTSAALDHRRPNALGESGLSPTGLANHGIDIADPLQSTSHNTLAALTQHLGVNEVHVVGADVAAEHGHVVEHRPPTRHQRGNAGHPRAGKGVKYHVARFGERLDEGRYGGDGHLGEVGVRHVDGVAAAHLHHRRQRTVRPVGHSNYIRGRSSSVASHP